MLVDIIKKEINIITKALSNKIKATTECLKNASSQ